MIDPRRQQGFTLVEVMMTLLVFGVSILGLVAMHSASVEGSHKSREHTTAVNIARFFMTQLQSEVAGWRTPPPGTDKTLPDNLFIGTSGRVLLKQAVVLNAIEGTEQETWFLLDDTGELRIDSYMGHSGLVEDSVVNSAASRFCVSYRLELMDVPQNVWNLKPEVEQVANGMVWKVRVRVIWPRRNQFSMFFYADAENNPPCTIANINNWLSDTTLPAPEIVELVGIATREFAL